ncbi:MAG: PAS domain S-box protein [Burkholderiales bacterium]
MQPRTQDSSPPAELRAIKWFTLTHAAGLVAFGLLMGGFFWYLHHVMEDQQRQALYRDIEWAQQSIRLGLREHQDEIAGNAVEWALARRGPPPPARDFLARHPDLAYLAFVGPEREVRWLIAARGVPGVAMRAPGSHLEDSAGFGSFHEARDERRPLYTAPFLGDENEVLVELHTPVLREGVFAGMLVAGYSLRRILTVYLSPEVRERYQVSLTDQGGNELVSSSPRRIHEANLSYELPLDPPGRGVRLRAFVFDARPRLLERSLMLAVIGLSLASAVSLALLWRHARRRLTAEAERDRLFRLSGDLMCVIEAAGRFSRVNPAFSALFGPLAERRSLTDLAHPHDRQAVARALLKAAERGPDGADLEARFEHPQGWRWLQWSLRGDPEGSTGHVYGVAHDVTSRKNTETALAAETSFRQAMEDSMLTGMRAFDMEGRVIYVNRAFCEMTGYPSNELVGRTAPYPYWPADDHEAQYSNLDMILAGRAPSSGVEVRIQRRDGSRFDARMYVSPLVDRDRRQTGWMSSITDITEPKRIREALASAHERFTTVLDELDAAIWVLPDAPGGVEPLFANHAFRAILGDDAEAAAVLAGAAAGHPDGLPCELAHAASGRWFEVRSRGIRWVDGRQARMLMASDVTRRHAAEDRQREQEEKLGLTSRLVTMGEMASSLAHELNQPLTAIANYCMGLSARIRTRQRSGQPPEPDETLEALGKTAAQAERAGMVIRRIREFVKRSEPERRPCEAAAIIDETLGLAEIEARKHGIRIAVDLAPALPTLLADPILVEQVLLNLIRNALEAMQGQRRRELRVGVSLRADWVEFSVSDTGPGLSAEAAAKLFEPFFTTKQEGMGMGLNICRSIVESHQGRLWTEPAADGGCVFRFTLPVPGEAELARAA